MPNVIKNNSKKAKDSMPQKILKKIQAQPETRKPQKTMQISARFGFLLGLVVGDYIIFPLHSCFIFYKTKL